MVEILERIPSETCKGDIVIKSIAITEDKNSITYTYRKNKDGVIECTGFDVKVYGEQTNIIQSKADQLIIKGINRMNNPFVRDQDDTRI